MGWVFGHFGGGFDLRWVRVGCGVARYGGGGGFLVEPSGVR